MTIEPGQQLLHYRLIEKIGEGGMGVVWKAEDTRLHRHVALKFVPEEGAEDAQAVERHLREARAASALNHPNICSIYDIGEWEGRQFIVMELLEGRSLQQHIGGKPMEVEAAIEFAIQIADALAAAHAKGIIHRDIKPGNIFLPSDGGPRILDFGLARLDGNLEGVASSEATTEGFETSEDKLLGTVAYMSPEQVRGRRADARSDIFSLGCVLYQQLSGQGPFSRATAADTMAAILKDAPPDLSQCGRKLPPGLDRLIIHCLEKDPEKRFQSARDLAFALRSIGES